MIRIATTLAAAGLAIALGLATSDSWGFYSLLVTLPSALLMGFGAGWLSDYLGRER